MKKAVVIGGSNGIGLSIVNALIKKGYNVNILDIVEPDINLICDMQQYAYEHCNLLDFDEILLEKYANDPKLEVLMRTAGFGRVTEFEHLHIAEIENIIKLNTAAGIKAIRIFYNRIKNNDPFYCGMMGSIAGLVNSPLFSVYAASKAAICRFIESVNVELEMAGVSNRILNVSPGSIKGTKFNGGENDLNLTNELAEEILSHMFGSNELFIPDYESIYKSVIERNAKDAHSFGVESYKYKKDSGRVVSQAKVCIGYLSGTFDLFHVGHLNLLRRAKEQCDYLIVGVHPDASHKGKETFIPYEERKAIVGGIKYVDKVVQSCREDHEAWEKWHYTKLFVGSDYKGTERFVRYEEYFKDKNVEIVYFPYTQGTSSTQIRKTVLLKTKDIEMEKHNE